MSRLPRRSSRVKPPLRGRAATKHYRGEFAPIAALRRPSRPYSPRPFPRVSKPLPPPCQERPPDTHPHTPQRPSSPDPRGLTFVQVYKRWAEFIRNLDQPWQWCVALGIVLSGLLLLNQLR